LTVAPESVPKKPTAELEAGRLIVRLETVWPFPSKVPEKL